MMTKMLRATMLALATALLAACGQKGALYLEEPDREVITSVQTAPAATPAARDEDDEAPPAAPSPAPAGGATQ